MPVSSPFIYVSIIGSTIYSLMIVIIASITQVREKTLIPRYGRPSRWCVSSKIIVVSCWKLSPVTLILFMFFHLCLLYVLLWGFTIFSFDRFPNNIYIASLVIFCCLRAWLKILLIVSQSRLVMNWPLVVNNLIRYLCALVKILLDVFSLQFPSEWHNLLFQFYLHPFLFFELFS